MKIGSHVSNNGELMLAGSLAEALGYGANCFMVYLGAPQTTLRKDISLSNADIMKDGLKQYKMNIADVIVHAPYIVNLAQGDEEKRQFAVDFITSEMKRMAYVGCKYMVVHPGAHMKDGIDIGLERISKSLKQILVNTKNDDTYIAIETMAGKGTECCFEFWQIQKIMELCKEQSDRLVVCFDTCHTHDAGYDIVNKYDEVMNEFDKLIGLDKIKVIHLNDSKNECGAKKDRHDNFGFGHIGYQALMQFVDDKRFIEVPKILETPYVKDGNNEYPPYKYEIEMIKNHKFDKNMLEKVILQN